MELQIFKTLWGHTGGIEQAVEQAVSAGMNGIEGPAPSANQQRQVFKHQLQQQGLHYIAEITTAGSYVPDRWASVADHLRDFQTKLQYSLELEPLFITCIGGCDAWSEQESVEFFQQAMAIAQQHQILVSFETHRARSLFNPWVTQRIASEVPEMLFTFDFSHWCVVCERLMDSELPFIEQLATQAHHIHARIGYDQGPQVPHPAAAEYAAALEAHQRWWEILWQSQQQRGYEHSTMTPEFGPDGYLHLMPFSQEPVADLWEINQWMAGTEREHFARWQG